jgi:hypothetical protein
VTDHEYTQFGAYAKQQEAIFQLATFVVIKLDGLLIEKDGSCLVERYPMLALVLAVLPLIPLKSQTIHNYTVNTEWLTVKGSLLSEAFALLCGFRT